MFDVFDMLEYLSNTVVNEPRAVIGLDWVGSSALQLKAAVTKWFKRVQIWINAWRAHDDTT
jgi:hypothetical protein